MLGELIQDLGAAINLHPIRPLTVLGLKSLRVLESATKQELQHKTPRIPVRGVNVTEVDE